MTHTRSKTVATWLALLVGPLGLHRFYLHGFRDRLGWLHPLPTAIGVFGVLMMRANGQDDQLPWLLIPLLGLMISQAMLCAIVYGLTPDDKWAARFRQPPEPTDWGPVLGAITALLVGGAVLMGTIAFSVQKFFEWQLDANPPRADAAAGAAAAASVVAASHSFPPSAPVPSVLRGLHDDRQLTTISMRCV